MQQSWGSIRQRKAVLLLSLVFLIALFSRLWFREISFWDWDEVLYANALHRFDVIGHSPHPPGYPVYVALGRLFRLLTGDDLKALVFLNVLFGSLAVFPLYYFFKRFTDTTLVFWAMLIFIFNPIVWLSSENAFSDTTGFFWIMLSLAFLLYSERGPTYLYLGAFFLGIALGVRPQNLLLAIIVFPFVLCQRLRRREYKAVAISVGLFSAACLIWFVPLCYYNGGLKRYLSFLRDYWLEVKSGDRGILNVSSQDAPYNLKQELLRVWGNTYLGAALCLLWVIGLGAFIKKRKWTELFLLSASFLPYLMLVILSLDPDFLKYCIPYLPFFCFFVAVGFSILTSALGRFRKVAFSLSMAALVSFFIVYMYPVLRIKHTEKSPVVAALDCIRANLKPGRDLILADQEFGVFVGYYLPAEFKCLVRDDWDSIDQDLASALNTHTNWFSLTGWYPDLSSAWKRDFKQTSRRLYLLDSKTYFNVWLSQVEVLYGTGWAALDASEYVVEPSGEATRQMVGSRASCYLRDQPGLDKTLGLQADVPLSQVYKRRKLTFYLDGKPIDEFYQDSVPLTKVYPVAAELLQSRAWSKLEIAIDPTYNPAKEAGEANDGEYGISVSSLTWLNAVWDRQDQARVLDFTTKSAGCLIDGWTPPTQDDEGHSVVWNTDKDATVLLPLRRCRDFKMLLNAFLNMTDQRFFKIKIYVNDTYLTDLVFNEPQVWEEHVALIPKADLVKGLNRIRFQFAPDAASHTTPSPPSLEGAVTFDYIKLVPTSG